MSDGEDQSSESKTDRFWAIAALVGVVVLVIIVAAIYRQASG
jgi:cobalamin biosynthesis Mg chelatase CobN